MKKLFVFIGVVILVASANSFALYSASAEEARQPQLDVAQDCGGGPERVAAASTASTAEPRSQRPDQIASMTYPPVVAVSCSSDQWCCKHDIGGTGACTKCCQK